MSVEKDLEPFATWAKDNGLTMEAEEIPDRTDGTIWDIEGANHWRVTLTLGGNSMDMQYSQGAAYRRWRRGFKHRSDFGYWMDPHSNARSGQPVNPVPNVKIGGKDWQKFIACTEAIPPQIGGLLWGLARDAEGVVNNYCFEDWAGDYGYDPDSRRAEKIYRLTQEQTAKLRRVLGNRLFEELILLEEEY